MSQNRIYVLADLEIDPARGEIRRAGESVSVETRVRAFLFLLIRAEGRILSQQEIQEQLWPGVHVSRDALYRVVKEARAIVGDDGRRQRVIRTLPGQGVRWVAELEIRDFVHSITASPNLESVQALYDAGQIGEAREQALVLARSASGKDDVSLRARALVWAADLMLHGHVDREWLTLAKAVIDELDPEDASLRAELLCRKAYQLYWSRNRRRCREVLEIAREISGRQSLSEASAWVALVDHMLCEGPEKLPARREHAERAARHARDGGRPQTRQWALEQIAHDAMEAGDLAAVEAQADAIDLLAEEQALVWSSRIRTLLQLHQGDLPAAERALLREVARYPNGGSHIFQYLGGPILWLRHEQGRLSEMLPLLRQFVAGGGELAVWRAALACAECEAGDADVARREYEGLAAGGFRDVDGVFVSAVTLAHIAESCLHFGDRDRAPWLVEQILPYRGRLIVSPRASFSLGPSDRLLGLLYEMMGQRDEAKGHLDDALALSTSLGALPSQVRCHEALAHWLSAAEGQSGKFADEAEQHAQTARKLRLAFGIPGS